MYKCPVTYYKDNLIFGADGSCWAVFELQGFDYDLLAEDSKVRIFQRLTALLSNIASEAKFQIIPVSQDLDALYEQLQNELLPSDPLHETALYQSGEVKEYLRQMVNDNGKSNDYKTFFYVKLNKSMEDDIVQSVQDAFDFLVKSITQDIHALFQIDTKDIRSSKVRRYVKTMEQTHLEQSQRLTLLKPTTDTVQWLLRRPMVRGLEKDVQLFQTASGEPWRPHVREVSLAGQSYLRPRSREMVNLFHGVIKRESRSLRMEHSSGEVSYQTFLALTHIPDAVSFPDCEWIYYMQKLNEQAEVCIHIRNHEHREALKLLGSQRKKIGSNIDNIEETNKHEVPIDLWDNKAALEALEQELKAGKFPLMDVAITICLADKNPEALENKVLRVRQRYEDLNCTIERPLTDQLALFMHSFPAVGFTVADFIMKLPPPALAAGMIGATHQLGDDVASFIGTTGEGYKPVHLNMALACIHNMSACATFYGDLGYGKSFNANLLLYLHVLNGGYGLIIDPKGERSHWPEQLEALKGFITVTTLSNDPKYKGMLDPFNVFRNNLTDACSLVVNVLTDKLKLDSDTQTALLEALEQIKKAAAEDETVRPSMHMVMDYLNRFPEDDDLRKPASNLARRIRLLQNSGLFHLLVGNGTEESLALDNRLNILQIQNLKLPSPETKKEDYTDEETTSAALMTVISAFCQKFVQSYPHNFKMILMDESWFMGKTAEGQKLISYIARTSRSLYCSLILNGHSVNDLPTEELKNTITYKFCFHTSSREEARRMLDYLKLEKTEDNISILLNLKNRQCLFQDRNGRTGILTFDAVFADLIDVFSTTPTDASAIAQGEEEEV